MNFFIVLIIKKCGSHLYRETIKINILNKQKHGYINHTIVKTKLLNGTIVNQEFTSLPGKSLEITLPIWNITCLQPKLFCLGEN